MVVVCLHTRFSRHLSASELKLSPYSHTFSVYSPSPHTRPDLGGNWCTESHFLPRHSAPCGHGNSSRPWRHVSSQDDYFLQGRRPCVFQIRCRSLSQWQLSELGTHPNYILAREDPRTNIRRNERKDKRRVERVRKSGEWRVWNSIYKILRRAGPGGNEPLCKRSHDAPRSETSQGLGRSKVTGK
jgi:hypothetical protein